MEAEHFVLKTTSEHEINLLYGLTLPFSYLQVVDLVSEITSIAKVETWRLIARDASRKGTSDC
jgi:hypothetical protein